ncbi:GAP family protein [Mycolicibacterium neoaurum]|uniref:GAP family protein n=1 Tax=Mycolicibacterium neoaurum TaxID=1795 RepID=UPI00248C1D33|nr:GAP family protein [Mycolicibacterium neoaurum]WBP95666.1 GAP family protein [Mycolicibacterium neoaurum]WBS09348.1 GAP family protein [Mycolicibacterium neoaurum]
MWAELMSLAVVIAVSPASVIPAILMLNTPRPLAAGWSFAAGWVLSLIVATGLFVELSGSLPAAGGPAPAWVRPAIMALAVLLVLAGAVTWVRRGRSTRAPAWLRGLDSVTAWRALAAAPILAIMNPKVLSVCAAAGFSIGSTDGMHALAEMAAFAVMASLTVIMPVLSYAIWRERMEGPLHRLRVILERHNAVILAVVLVAVGSMLFLHAA